MTAVAPPISFQPPSRGWNTASGPQNGGMSSEDVSRMFMPGPRKTAPRTNSSSSLNSTASSNSTISASSMQSNGTSPASSDASGWGSTRKKPARGIWPAGKAEPTAGISTARPQSVSSASSGPSAASAISALHTPMLPSQQMANGQAQQNGTIRNGSQTDVPAVLYLSPMNSTFERKQITVPFFPEVLRVGRQTNAKTAPTPTNGYFDSKVLSRQHAEVHAERNGRIYIRDVKSSNGTFVNGQRLSQENKESEPHELRDQDVLELGIDIVSEDQKTVVHHKVAAKVDYAGLHGGQSTDLNFGDLDPSAGPGFGASQQLKRNGSQGSIQGGKANLLAAAMAGRDQNNMQQPQWSRMWLTPITTETIVKRLNRELNLAKQQSQDLARTKQCIEGMLAGEPKAGDKENATGSEKLARPSPTKAKSDIKTQFSDPPAPPPQQPLPEKPDVAKALADPVIQPLLMRSDTARPSLSPNGSPTKTDHSQAILILTHELRLAKDQIPSLEERVRSLENELKMERTARESAEERAQNFSSGSPRKDSKITQGAESKPVEKDMEQGDQTGEQALRAIETTDPAPGLQSQLDRLRASMDEMKQQMEVYRRRAETAESERDEARQSLAEMIEQKRREHAEEAGKASLSKRRRSIQTGDTTLSLQSSANGHALGPKPDNFVAMTSLLEKAGMDTSSPITREQATALQRLLSQEVLGSQRVSESHGQQSTLVHHGTPFMAAAVVVVLGYTWMQILNGDWKIIK